MYRLNDKLRELAPYDPNPAADKIRLDANESFLPPPPQALDQAVERLRGTALNRYPDPSAKALREAFASRYGVPAGNVVAGNGSDELISALFLAFLQKGEAFATLEPDFSMYGFNGFLNEARRVSIPKRDYGIDVDQTLAACRREGVRLLIFSNPCNPTSVVCPREEVRRLVRGMDGLVVLDEAYMDFSDQSLLGEFQDYDNLVILRTCSKAVGAAALRLGFAVAATPLARALGAAKSPYNVNTFSQIFGEEILRQGEALDSALAQLLASRDQLLAGLRAVGERFPDRFRLLPCAANFAALALPDPEGAYRFLWDRGVAARLTGGLLRVTCGEPQENQAFLSAFEAYCQEGI